MTDELKQLKMASRILARFSDRHSPRSPEGEAVAFRSLLREFLTFRDLARDAGLVIEPKPDMAVMYLPEMQANKVVVITGFHGGVDLMSPPSGGAGATAENRTRIGGLWFNRISKEFESDVADDGQVPGTPVRYKSAVIVVLEAALACLDKSLPEVSKTV